MQQLAWTEANGVAYRNAYKSITIAFNLTPHLEISPGNVQNPLHRAAPSGLRCLARPAATVEFLSLIFHIGTTFAE